MTDALVIVDHGSRAPAAHEHLEWLAERVRERAPELQVHVAHMELASPSLAEVLERCAASGVRRVSVHPLFLVPGRHLIRDIPELVGDAASRHPELVVRLLPALGTREGLADLVLDTLREGASSDERG